VLHRRTSASSTRRSLSETGTEGAEHEQGGGFRKRPVLALKFPPQAGDLRLFGAPLGPLGLARQRRVGLPADLAP
jgi:hypothetical protein